MCLWSSEWLEFEVWRSQGPGHGDGEQLLELRVRRFAQGMTSSDLSLDMISLAQVECNCWTSSRWRMSERVNDDSVCPDQNKEAQAAYLPTHNSPKILQACPLEPRGQAKQTSAPDPPGTHRGSSSPTLVSVPHYSPIFPQQQRHPKPFPKKHRHTPDFPLVLPIRSGAFPSSSLAYAAQADSAGTAVHSTYLHGFVGISRFYGPGGGRDRQATRFSSFVWGSNQLRRVMSPGVVSLDSVFGEKGLESDSWFAELVCNPLSRTNSAL